MLTIGDFNVSGEIVLALVIIVSWVSAAISSIITKDTENSFGAAFMFSILAGIGYLFYKA